MSTHIPPTLNSVSRMKLNVVELSERDGNTDFRDLILEQLGDLSGFRVLGTNVMVATYVKPRKTAGGIILPENSVHEDRYQGKIGLVLKLGEDAFKRGGAYGTEPYKGTVPRIGDYVAFHTSDGREIGLRGVSVKFVDDSLIRMIVPTPDDIY